MKARGLKIDPKLAVGDCALGFWKALPQVYGATREQRCWVHKTANVLNKLPKHLQAKAKSNLHQIWMAPTRDERLSGRALDSPAPPTRSNRRSPRYGCARRKRAVEAREREFCRWYSSSPKVLRHAGERYVIRN